MSESQPISLVPVFTATGSLTGIPGAVGMRDAQAATHAADGAARVTGRPAIVVADGLADTLKVASGLVTAAGDRQLVVALVSVDPLDRAIAEPALVTASRSWVDGTGMTANEVVGRVASHTPTRLPVAVLLDGPEQTAAVAVLLAESIAPGPIAHALAPVEQVEGLNEALADLREARRPLVLGRLLSA